MDELHIWVGYEKVNNLITHMHFSDLPFNKYCHYNLLSISRKTKIRTADVSTRHQGRQQQVDQKFVDSGRNWARATAPLGRGDGGELGERRQWTNWLPELRRRPWPAAADGGTRGGNDIEG